MRYIASLGTELLVVEKSVARAAQVGPWSSTLHSTLLSMEWKVAERIPWFRGHKRLGGRVEWANERPESHPLRTLGPVQLCTSRKPRARYRVCCCSDVLL